MSTSEKETPLQGVRVIELGGLIAGPYAASLFAQFGAEVIKVEAPGDGDPLRRWRKLHNGTSLWWYSLSRNKKSITLNLKSEQGRRIVRALVEKADVVIENFRPGTLETWGLGWEDLSKINPRLILVRISGYGQNGPYRDRPEKRGDLPPSPRRSAACGTSPDTPIAHRSASGSAWAIRSRRSMPWSGRSSRCTTGMSTAVRVRWSMRRSTSRSLP